MTKANLFIRLGMFGALLLIWLLSVDAGYILHGLKVFMDDNQQWADRLFGALIAINTFAVMDLLFWRKE